MSTIIKNHPINALCESAFIKKRKIAADDYVEMEDYHHFDNIRRYLMDLAVTFPNCVSRTGRKQTLKCTCCSVFKNSQAACCVAAYLLQFGKQDNPTKKMIVMEWIRLKKMDDEVSGNQPYSLPYLPFSEFEDILRDEAIFCYDIPFDLLYNHRVCKTTIMNILGVGKLFMKTCQETLKHGPKPSLLQNNKNASKQEILKEIDSFFE